MLIKPYGKDERCEQCGKLLNDIVEEKIECVQCTDAAYVILASTGFWQHCWDSVKCFFNFDFVGFFVELVWAFQSLTKTGDYGPNGIFTQVRKRSQKQETVEIKWHKNKDKDE